MSTHNAVVASPIGRIGIRLDAAGRLICLDFLGSRAAVRGLAEPASLRVANALEAYFSDPGYRFELPLLPVGTPYQLKVWAALRRIPSGETRSYGQLAAAIASAPRAVGQACRRNPIPIIVPCHRVVARAGPGGYSGATAGPSLAIKQWLLKHEGIVLPS